MHLYEKDYFIKFGFGLVGCESKEEKQARLNLVVKSFSEEIVKQDLIDPSSAMFSNQKGFVVRLTQRIEWVGMLVKLDILCLIIKLYSLKMKTI